MMKDDIQICILGAGNVAFHFCATFTARGLSMIQLYARNKHKADIIASQFNIPTVSDLDQLEKQADIYILAVSDNAISAVAKQLSDFIAPSSLVVHCSGAIPSSVLAKQFKRYGAFYPLQTLKKGQSANFEKIPICVFASDPEGTELLHNLAKHISGIVRTVNDKQRAILHVAAVFANNFSNYLFEISYELLKEQDIDFDLLVPLILETAEKMKLKSPSDAQTGPAIRGDQNTINRHLKLLADHPDYQRLYRLLTKSINKDLDI